MKAFKHVIVKETADFKDHDQIKRVTDQAVKRTETKGNILNIAFSKIGRTLILFQCPIYTSGCIDQSHQFVFTRNGESDIIITFPFFIQ